MAKEYKFQYMPLEGRLPGLSFERQTEDAINDLGQTIINIEESSSEASELAKEAYEKATEAQTTADAAQTTAENANTAAQDAQNTAQNAQDTANAASEKADAAEKAANTASDKADSAEATANEAKDTATSAEEKAEAAENTAETAQSTADNAYNMAVSAAGKVDTLTSYECTGFDRDPDDPYDLDDFTEFARLHTAAGTLNAPTSTDEYFVDVDINSDNNMVRQKAVKVDFDWSLPTLDGTVWIEGDLNVSGTLNINGSLRVDGDITGDGTVNASGDITCSGTVSATANANASLTSADIEEEGHGTTFRGSVALVDGVLTTEMYMDVTGTLRLNIPCNFISSGYTIYNDGILDINADMTVGSTDMRAFNNRNGTLTVAEGVTMQCIGSSTRAYGYRQSDGGTTIVNGEMYCTSESDDKAVYIAGGTVSGTGKIYANGEIYYDGTNGISVQPLAADGEEEAEAEYIRWGEKDGDSVTWNVWKSGGSGGGNSMTEIIGMTPNWYKRQSLFGSDKTTVTVYANTQINIGGKGYISQVDTVLDITTLGSADERAGKDVYIYACQGSGSEPVFVLSMNSTVPDGYDENNSRKIGGFHCLCLSAGTIADCDASGYNTGEVIPISMWDLLFRANSENEGMVYKYHAWWDIYDTSWDGEKLVSVFNATPLTGYTTPAFHGDKFAEYAALIGKRLIWHDEWISIAKGSNEGTREQNSTLALTGGHYDTAGRRMISSCFLEDCCGYLYKWTQDTSFAFNSTGSSTTYQYGGVDTTETNFYADGYKWDDYYRVVNPDVDGDVSMGNCYGGLLRMLVGCWAQTAEANCGSRAVSLRSLTSLRGSNSGCRLASEPRVVNL